MISNATRQTATSQARSDSLWPKGDRHLGFRHKDMHDLAHLRDDALRARQVIVQSPACG